MGKIAASRELPALGKKDIYWLEAAAYVGTGMYQGEKWKCAPARFQKLHRLGLVNHYYPHNPVHDDRAVITAEGEAVLRERRRTG